MELSKKQFIVMIAVVAMIALAGCSETNEGGEGLAKDTGQNVTNVDIGESYWYEVKMTEKNQFNLVKQNPPFMMDYSLERQNLIRRYKYLNDRNNVHHVYLMSNDGKVISYFVAQGKVSSVNSKLTNDQQILRVPNCDAHQGGEGGCFKSVESPQMDGSYGTNGAAIFFFTTSGDYVEYNGKYVVSEKALNIQTAISLQHEVGPKQSNASAATDIDTSANTSASGNATA